MTDTATAEARETPFEMCVSAARMARHNAKVWRRRGNLEAAHEAYERAGWYLDLARRRRNQK